MLEKSNELVVSFFLILLLTIVYLITVLALGGIPPAREFFGHSLGIAGFLLMVFTETAYTLRKRSGRIHFGKMSVWLQIHIITGLVGPYMVMLHSAWKLNGIAGVTLLLTGLIVLSGFIGRYIFSAIPRSSDGLELTAQQIESERLAAEAHLREWMIHANRQMRVYGQSILALQSKQANTFWDYIAQRLDHIALQIQLGVLNLRLDREKRTQLTELRNLTRTRQRITWQLQSQKIARRALSIWHTIHVPMGITLFVLSGIHIIAALYYATLLY